MGCEWPRCQPSEPDENITRDAGGRASEPRPSPIARVDSRGAVGMRRSVGEGMPLWASTGIWNLRKVSDGGMKRRHPHILEAPWMRPAGTAGAQVHRLGSSGLAHRGGSSRTTHFIDLSVLFLVSGTQTGCIRYSAETPWRIQRHANSRPGWPRTALTGRLGAGGSLSPFAGVGQAG